MSGIFENVCKAVETDPPAASVQKLFPLSASTSGFVDDIIELPTLADVGQCRQCHILIGNGRKCGGSRWSRFDICFRSIVISTSGFHFRFRGRHLRFRCRPRWDNDGSAMFGSGILENVGVAVEIALPSVSVQKLVPRPVPWPTLWVPDVGLYRTMSAVSYFSRALSKV